jgi:perosamine synthetase
MKFIPQFIPYWDESEKKAVVKILDKDYLNEHKTVREFEKKFSEFVGAKYCITCTSGTTALYLALKSLYEKKIPKKINIPDYAGIFVGNACIQAGIHTQLSDVSDNGSLVSNAKPRFVVHSNGRLGSTQILEDCAQAISHHTKNSISCYSFASTKHITTSGQGGAICCDDKKIFDILSRLKDLGRNDRQNLKPMSDHFAFWGINSKFTEIQAAFGLAQLKKLPKRLTRLKKMYKIIQEELKHVDQVSFFQDEPKWYIDILVENPDILIQKLQTHGIQARRFYRPLHQQPLYKSSKKNFKNSNSLYDHGIWLPSTTNITDEELVYVAKKIKESLSN